MFNVVLYQDINKELFNKMKPKYKFDYSYKSNGDFTTLKAEEISKTMVKIEDSDETSDWNYIDYGFKVKGYITLRNAYNLLISQRIVVRDTKVGVAVTWGSTESKQRGIVRLGNLNKTVDDNFTFELNFTKNQLLSSLKLQLMFFIDKPGTLHPNERHIANSKGNILGVFDILNIQLEGIGSLFPIYTVTEPGQTLYMLEVKTDANMFEDQFNEVVGIFLNSSHTSYKFIDIKQKDYYNSSFFSEVIASAMSTLLMILDKEGYIKDLNKNIVPEEGSVMQVVNYFIEVLEWDVTSYEGINKSIRLYLDKRL